MAGIETVHIKQHVSGLGRDHTHDHDHDNDYTPTSPVLKTDKF
jgi:membrane protein